MPADNNRLDRLLSKRLNIKRKLIKPLIAKGTVQVNGVTVFDVDMPVNQFSYVTVGDVVIQNKQAHYIMLNKPKGYVSATKDTIHPTIMQLIHEPFRDELRIVGRLDFNTTGLMLLTNDSDWATSLSHSTK
ncbi:MAG: 16S rRNA pseudouridine(516) synthase, partial [Sinobacterium sp.]|nr:16S rRNA pseudouridine(516) synthase [Sinobacterium sp.]